MLLNTEGKIFFSILSRHLKSRFKSRSLVLQKGKIKSTARFTIAGEFIPTVTEKPVKSLGKWFDSSTKDQAAIMEVPVV